MTDPLDTTIRVGDSHWCWHVDQLATVIADRGSGLGVEEAMAGRHPAVEARCFVGTGDFQGSRETWNAAVAEACAQVLRTRFRLLGGGRGTEA